MIAKFNKNAPQKVKDKVRLTKNDDEVFGKLWDELSSLKDVFAKWTCDGAAFEVLDIKLFEQFLRKNTNFDSFGAFSTRCGILGFEMRFEQGLFHHPCFSQKDKNWISQIGKNSICINESHKQMESSRVINSKNSKKENSIQRKRKKKIVEYNYVSLSRLINNFGDMINIQCHGYSMATFNILRDSNSGDTFYKNMYVVGPNDYGVDFDDYVVDFNGLYSNKWIEKGDEIRFRVYTEKAANRATVYLCRDGKRANAYNELIDQYDIANANHVEVFPVLICAGCDCNRTHQKHPNDTTVCGNVFEAYLEDTIARANNRFEFQSLH